ncbi:hypothetical protein RBB50_002226 [Rhinocladiella similis]
MSSIVNVAVAGPTGSLGTAITKALHASGLFEVTMLLRSAPKDLLPGVKFALVDYSDTSSLQRSLVGQDAVVSALPREMVLAQILLIDLAITAGVQRFIPSEFGANLQNEKSRHLPNYHSKVQVEEYLESKAALGQISYTYIYTNALLDWSIRAGIVLDFRKQSVSLYDGGENPVSMTTIPTAANAVTSVLLKPLETKNRAVYVHDIIMSQKELFTYAKEVSGSQIWKEEVVDLVELAEAARKENPVATTANPNMTLFHAGAMSGGFAQGYGNRFGESDIELLAIEPLHKGDLKTLLRELYEESRGT